MNEYNNLIPEVYRDIDSEKGNVFLYGDGQYAEMVWNDLERFKCAKGIKGVFVSKDHWRVGKTFHGLTVEAFEGEKNVVLIIGFDPIGNEDKLIELLNDESVTKLYIWNSIQFLRDKQWIGSEQNKIYYMDGYYNISVPRKLNREYAAAHAEEWKNTYSWLEDPLSKQIMQAYLEGHLEIKNYPMKKFWSPKSANDQYFPDVLRFTDKETIIDCGAFDGDTFQSYIEHVGHFCKYYAFEPDHDLHTSLKHKLAYYEGTVLYPYGVGAEHSWLAMSKVSGCGTFCNGEVGEKIEVVTLDSLFQNEKITFMKMDVEGSELDALRGAENIISKNRPKLAICVYHKREDLIEIPRFLKEIHHDYKFYLRAHWPNLSELVLYAV